MHSLLPVWVPRISFVPGLRWGIVDQRAHIIQRDVNFLQHQTLAIDTTAREGTERYDDTAASGPLNGSRGGDGNKVVKRPRREKRRMVRINRAGSRLGDPFCRQRTA